MNSQNARLPERLWQRVTAGRGAFQSGNPRMLGSAPVEMAVKKYENCMFNGLVFGFHGNFTEKYGIACFVLH